MGKKHGRILEYVRIWIQAFLWLKISYTCWTLETPTAQRNAEGTRAQRGRAGGWWRSIRSSASPCHIEIIPYMEVYVSVVCWGLELVLSNFLHGPLSQFKIILWAIHSITCFSKIYHSLISIWICSLRCSSESPFLKFQLSTSLQQNIFASLMFRCFPGTKCFEPVLLYSPQETLRFMVCVSSQRFYKMNWT